MAEAWESRSSNTGLICCTPKPSDAVIVYNKTIITGKYFDKINIF